MIHYYLIYFDIQIIPYLGSVKLFNTLPEPFWYISNTCWHDWLGQTSPSSCFTFFVLALGVSLSSKESCPRYTCCYQCVMASTATQQHIQEISLSIRNLTLVQSQTNPGTRYIWFSLFSLSVTPFTNTQSLTFIIPNMFTHLSKPGIQWKQKEGKKNETFNICRSWLPL